MVGKWTRGLVVALVGIAIVALAMTSCSKERGVEPTPQHSRVYVSVQGMQRMVYVFDADADSLLDSLNPPSNWGAARVICDPASPRIALAYSEDAMFYRAGDREAYASKTLASLLLGFDSERGVVICSYAALHDGTPGRFDVYSLSDLSLIFEDTIGIASEATAIDYKRGLVFGNGYFASESGGQDERLCAYDYVHHRLHGRWNTLAGSLALHPDGRRAFISVGTPRGARLLSYDLAGDSALFDIRLPHEGNVELTPDGESVWYAVPGNAEFGGPETITIFNAATGTVQSVITLTPYRAYPYRKADPTGIVFTPSGEKAYVTCSDWGGPVLAIDVASQTVTKAFYFKRGENPEPEPRHMDIGPAP